MIAPVAQAAKPATPSPERVALAQAIIASQTLNRHTAAQSGFGAAGCQLLHVEANTVLRSEATAHCATLAIELDGLQRALARKGAELLELVALGVFPPDQFGTRPNQTLSAVINRLQTPPVLWRDLAAEQDAGRAKWADALARLGEDAAARLPSQDPAP